MKGRDLQHHIIDLARTLRWRVAHTPPIRDFKGIWRTAVAADGKGFPDLVLVRDRIVVAEIKGDGDKVTPEQHEWLTAFSLAGVSCYIWTPESWASGHVDEVLKYRKGGDNPPTCPTIAIPLERP